MNGKRSALLDVVTYRVSDILLRTALPTELLRKWKHGKRQIPIIAFKKKLIGAKLPQKTRLHLLTKVPLTDY